MDNWEPHLQALVSVINRISPTSINNYDMNSDQSFNGLILAQRFLITKVVWLDVLASTATGKPPRSNYHEWLDLVEIETCTSDVFGYQNWVMKAIGDLSIMFSDDAMADSEPDSTKISEIKALLEDDVDRRNPLLVCWDRNSLSWKVLILSSSNHVK